MNGRQCLNLARNLRMARVSVPAMRATASMLPTRSPVYPAAGQPSVWLRPYSADARDVQKEIGQLVKNTKVVVFMKGVPDAPRCGFSNAVVQIMRMHDVQYEAHDVLSDEELRQGVKEFSNWPTIPQVYMEGEFIGGCDILLQMHQSGELVEELTKIGIKSALLGEDDKK